jgi:hypothetical protein
MEEDESCNFGELRGYTIGRMVRERGAWAVFGGIMRRYIRKKRSNWAAQMQ